MNRVNAIDNTMSEIEALLAQANEKLQKMTEGKFPFAYEEVVMTVESDSAGIYIRSGLTPVVAVARAGSPESALREIKAKVWEELDYTRTAIERRAGLKDEVAAMAADSDKQEKARAALEAAGLPVDMVNGGIDKEAAEALVAAARKAVRKANTGLNLQFGSALEAVGGWQAAKMKIVGYAGGFVITAGGKPCLITRFPKVANAKAVERMLRFIEADVEALSANRRQYFAYLREKVEQEERLHELAAKFDGLNAELSELAAMAM